MAEQSDSKFISNISIVIGLLVVFAICIFFIARDIGSQGEAADSATARAATKERIAPVGGAYTGEAGAAAIEQAASTASEAPTAAFGGSLDAQMIYTTVCGVCHATGAAEAPIPGTDAMAERAARGMEALAASVINGLNAMPPRGGRADLSDEQIQAVVEYMMQ